MNYQMFGIEYRFKFPMAHWHMLVMEEDGHYMPWLSQDRKYAERYAKNMKIKGSDVRVVPVNVTCGASVLVKKAG